MKAVVFQAPRQMSVADLPRPEIGPDEVLIASRAVGICHSDFEVLDGHYIIPVRSGERSPPCAPATVSSESA